MDLKHYTKKDFAWTQWSPVSIERVISRVLAAKRERYEAIKKIPKDKRTFENTVFGIESSNYDTVEKVYPVHFLMNVSPKKAVRDAAKTAIDKFDKEIVDIEYDADVHRAFKEYAEMKEKLSGVDKKLFDDRSRDYKRMGFGLSKEKQKRLKAVTKKLNALGTQFGKNINDYKDHITVHKNETEGLPDHYLQGLKRDAKGRYIVTLDYPDYFPFIQNAKSAKRRKEIIDKALQKGGERNMKILQEMLKLRQERAKLLGYPNHAAFQTEIKMAENPGNVEAFIKNLVGALKKKLKEEFQEILLLKREITKNPKATLDYYDVSNIQAYYISELKKRKFDIDDEKVREYFPLEIVKRGTLKIYSKLFSVEFVKLTGYPTWHKDVEVYAVKDKNNETISYFMLDLYPREGKYGHAAVFDIIPGRVSIEKGKEKYNPPVACMVTNFKKPTKAVPSLLTHDEMETFFHEFGHVVHVVLTKARYASQSGANVARDFVEAPSQMLVHWVWDRKMLNILSGHYKNPAKKLPKKLSDNLLAAKNHMIAYWAVRQLVLASLDMGIHTSSTMKDANKVLDQIMRDYFGITMPKRSIYPAGFGHIGGGYDAGYYGYMWSNVYAADMFTRFEKEGLLNKKTGADYKKWILEKGSSMNEIELVKKFLGRKPNNKAFLKERGL